MREQYDDLEIEVIRFETEDVISTSDKMDLYEGDPAKTAFSIFSEQDQ